MNEVESELIRIEDAIPMEKHPQATFLTPNAM
jgi:hypothetical protein